MDGGRPVPRAAEYPGTCSDALSPSFHGGPWTHLRSPLRPCRNSMAPVEQAGCGLERSPEPPPS